MRVGAIIASALVVTSVSMVAAQVSTGDRSRTTDATVVESPCLLLVAGIERNQQVIENGRDRLASLVRVAGEADRRAIREFSDQLADRMEQFRATYGDMVRRMGTMSEQELVTACRTNRTQLAAARDRIVAEVGKLRRFETEMRARIATTRRLGQALRVTDDMLVKATRISRRTGEGEDAFPGLRRAYELQENAKQALAAGRLEAAMRITLKARDILGQTLREALDEQDVQQVRRHAQAVYKNTAEIVKRLGEQIDAGKNPKAARLITVAESDLAKAREVVDERPYVAVRYVEHARRIVREMRRFYVRSNHCDERVARLDERLDKAREIVDEADNDKAAEVLSKAEEHYGRGSELCEAAESKKATVQLDIAAKLAARSVELAKDISRSDKAVAHEVRKTSLIVKKAASVASTDQQKRQVAKARELVGKARDRIDQPRVSLKLLDDATDLAFQVIAQARRAENDEPHKSNER